MILRLTIVKGIRRIAPEAVRGRRWRSTSQRERRHDDNLPVYAGVTVIREATRFLARLKLQLGNLQAVFISDFCRS